MGQRQTWLKVGNVGRDEGTCGNWLVGEVVWCTGLMFLGKKMWTVCSLSGAFLVF